MHRRWIPSQWHYLWLVLSLNHLSFPALIITDDNGHFQFFFRTPLFVRFFSLRFHTPFVIDNLIFQLKQYLQASNSHLPPIFHVISWDNIIILKANGTYVNSKNHNHCVFIIVMNLYSIKALNFTELVILLILCNAKCIQFHGYKKQERNCTVQLVFY